MTMFLCLRSLTHAQIISDAQLFGLVFGLVAVDVIFFAVRFLADPVRIAQSKSEPQARTKQPARSLGSH